uniref:Uncharacterized protein n=1 Tax=Anguilla anguilla TaxID=7936 RepID=A0A0E9WN90_ANGAN
MQPRCTAVPLNQLALNQYSSFPYFSQWLHASSGTVW